MILLACFISLSGLEAQNSNTKFEYLTIDDGLSSNRIYCILRDSKDFLWVSTSLGLDKYDSDRFVKYRFNEDIPESLSNNSVRCIFEDREKRLWLGTLNGLNLYNPAHDNFEIFKNIPSDTTSLNGNVITSIIEDLKGNLWILTDGNCLNKWIPESQSFIRYKFDNNLNGVTIINRQSIKMISIDSLGDFWIGSYARGIFHFNTLSGKFSKYDDPAVDFGIVCSKSLYIDKKDKIWIVTDGNGFFSYEPSTNKFKQFLSKPDGLGPDKNLVYDIIPDGDRYLLLAVDQGGINRFDKLSETFEYIKKGASDEGLNSDGIWCLYRDKEGVLWVGTSTGGINFYNPKKENFKLFTVKGNSQKSLSFSSVLCLFEDYLGMIWIGTDGGGINVYNPKTGNFTVYKHNSKDPYSISGNAILSISEDKDHDVWIGTWDAGLNRFDRKTGRFFTYLPEKNNPSSISTRTIWSIKTDRNGNIWLAGTQSGIDLFNKETGVMRRFRNDPTDPESITNSQAWQFYEDSEENMWICSTNGLYIYNSSTDTFKRYEFPDNAINAFLFDKAGNLWVGSASSGMYFCKPDGTILKTYTSEDGLPDNIIRGIKEGSDGYIWVTTTNGISRFDTRTQEFKNYSKEDGLQANEFHRQSFLETKSGEFYVGGYNGFNSFNPASLRENDFIPPVYITEFQIFNKPVEYGEINPQFPLNISEAKEITLKWNQSVFSFDFNAINYTFPGKNQYSYIMEGFESEWNFTNSSRRYVTYTNLNAGEYTFKVKASNNDGLWNDHGVALKIIILPPWWKTWWFQLILLVTLISAIASVFISRVKSLKNQKVVLEKTVALKTAELHEKNNSLVERQHLIENQKEELLTQKEALEEINDVLNELNASKDKFFSILAHDLRGPLSSFVGATEILYEDLLSMEKDDIKDIIMSMKTSSTNIYSLLENLLEWSSLMRNRIEFVPEKFNVRMQIAGCIDVLLESAGKKRIELKVMIADELEVLADKHMFDGVIRNLVSNAIKFTPTGGVVTIEANYRQNKNVIISISDTGIGMPPELVNKLFLINEKTNRKGTEGEPSSGLGLLLCKEFVEKHGGKIWVESEEGKGSIFKFDLPS